MKNILIIKCGETFQNIKNNFGDFENWIIKQTHLPEQIFKIYDLTKGEILPHPIEYIAAFITGSHYNVNQRLPWIKQLQNWIITARYVQLPVLGICFGHQIIASALGGKVTKINPVPQLGKSTILIEKNHIDNPLFKGIGGEFESYVSHGWEVTETGPGTEILAKDLKGHIMAIQTDKIFGIQFHPEFSESIIKMYLKEAKMPTSRLLGVKLRSEHKNQSIISNFIDNVLKF